MLTYSVLTTLYLICVGALGEGVGRLLWPAVVVHLVVAIVLLSAWLKEFHGAA
jgi:hypothetical protein